MARRSRKAEIAAAQGLILAPLSKESFIKIYSTALYGRLSIMDTRDRKDSESIETQMDYLKNYIENKPDLQFYACYCDNGETGTNFDRPGFQQMMADIKAGLVDCIVVKDLSRFGRDFLETGNFLEKVLPFLGVRFISINDQYDSAHADSSEAMTIALKNLMNDIYTKDISQKVYSALDTKKRNGDFIGNYAAYGYVKSPENKNRIIVDPKAAEVVRRIFQMKEDGFSNASIARALTASGVPNPSHYRYLTGILFSKRFAENAPWQTQAVKNILGNPVYLGHTVQGRKVSKLYENQRQKAMPKSEWIIVENTHEPIISQEQFDRVQQIMEERKAEYTSRLGKYDYFGPSENLFRGLVVCGCCKRNMTRYKEVYNRGRSISYRFICPSYAMHLTGACMNGGGFPETELKEIVFAVIKSQMGLLSDAEAVINRISKGAGAGEQRMALDREILSLQSRQKKVGALRQMVFESYSQKALSREDYLFASEQYAKELQALSEQLAGLLAQKAAMPEHKARENKWYAAFYRFRDEKELSRAMVHELIEKIYIHTDKSVEIILRYQDEMKKIFRGADGNGTPGTAD